MTRFFKTLEGEGKGARKPLTSSLMIVGRSKNADLQIEDALVSRRHLEVRVEGDTVFVENKSTHGSYLNGNPLTGVVSLNPGDVLDIGHTKLVYGEGSDEADVSAAPESMEPVSSEIDGTRIGGADAEMLLHKDREKPADATRAAADDHTRMLNPSELPAWAAQEKKAKDASSRGGRAGVILGLVLLAMAGTSYWCLFIRGNAHGSGGATIAYKDSLYEFALEYPLDWTKTADDTGVIEFGTGGEADPSWAHMVIHTDKDAEHALTGLTDGFGRYQDILKRRYAGFELLGDKPMEINGAAAIFYGFSTPKSQGKGIYVLNAEKRIVVECVSSKASYPQVSEAFSSFLQSFHLTDVSPQQFIDFPMPDEGMQQSALANPAAFSREVDGHAALGAMLLAGRDVRGDNLYRSVEEYRKALQLAIAPPQRVPAYQAIAGKLLEATTEYRAALDRLRFEISRATSNGDNDTAYWEASKMMQMVPDRADPAYQEANKVFRSLTRPKGL